MPRRATRSSPAPESARTPAAAARTPELFTRLTHAQGRDSYIGRVTHGNSETTPSTDEHYRQLFDALDQGFCTIEVLFDASGAPSDYRFIDVNGAFEQQTGLRNAIG